ncbi:hypothetical protein HPP92_000001, partial [Vanilla planifolia]
MATILGIGGDDAGVTSSSRRSWISTSFHEPTDVFRRSTAAEEDEEENLKWAAIEKLPTFERMRKGILRQFDDGGKVITSEVDVRKLGMQEKKVLVERIMKIVEEDNERFLKRLRDRFNQYNLKTLEIRPFCCSFNTDMCYSSVDRYSVGVDLPKIEVRFQNLSVEADAHVGSRALPTLLNATVDTLEGIFGFFRFAQSKKRINKILVDVSGTLKPSRMCLLLGPPGSGKTTLLLALAGKLNKKLR